MPTGIPLKRRKTSSGSNAATPIKNSNFKDKGGAINGQDTVNREFIKFVKGQFHNIRGDCGTQGSEELEAGATAAGVPKKRLVKANLKAQEATSPIQKKER